VRLHDRHFVTQSGELFTIVIIRTIAENDCMMIKLTFYECQINYYIHIPVTVKNTNEAYSLKRYGKITRSKRILSLCSSRSYHNQLSKADQAE